MPLVNRGELAAQHLIITPQPAVDPAQFPFEITNTSYAIETGDLAAGAETTVELGDFTLRSDLATGYYALQIDLQYANGVTTTVDHVALFVRVQGDPKPSEQAPPPVTVAPPPAVGVMRSEGPPAGMSEEVANGALFGGGASFSGGGPVDLGGSGSGGAPAQGYTPRVMLTSFTTDPQEVEAGQKFTLTFTLQNMSRSRGVGNIKVAIASAESAVLPTSGAGSVYIASIPAGQSASGSIEFRTLPGLEDRPQALTMRIEYEDAVNFQPLTADETLAIVVRQKPKATLGSMRVTPEVVEVGEDASVSFEIQNQGLAPLRNTRVRLKDGSPASATELFVGTIQPGMVGNADLIITAEEVTDDPIEVEVTYENSAGVATTDVRQISLSVTEAVDDDDDSEKTSADDSGVNRGPLLVHLFLLLMIAGVIGFVVVRRRQKRRKAAEMQQHLQNLDEEPLVPEDTLPTGRQP